MKSPRCTFEALGNLHFIGGGTLPNQKNVHIVELQSQRTYSLRLSELCGVGGDATLLESITLANQKYIN